MLGEKTKFVTGGGEKVKYCLESIGIIYEKTVDTGFEAVFKCV